MLCETEMKPGCGRSVADPGDNPLPWTRGETPSRVLQVGAVLGGGAQGKAGSMKTLLPGLGNSCPLSRCGLGIPREPHLDGCSGGNGA